MKIHCLCCALLVIAINTSAAPGDLDPSFSNDGKLVDWLGAKATDVAIQADGKIVVVGGPSWGSSLGMDFTVARYNEDGSPDATFGFGTGKVMTDFGIEGYAASVLIQRDGKIVVGGLSGSSFVIARYNVDGTLDTSFGNGTGTVSTLLPCGSTSENSTSADLKLQRDGKLLAVSTLDWCEGVLLRYLPSGALDTSFGTLGSTSTGFGFWGNDTSVAFQPDGKVLVSVGSRLLRFEPNGLPDVNFGVGGSVQTTVSMIRSVIAEPDSKVVVFGSSQAGRQWGFALARYNSDGSGPVTSATTPPMGSNSSFLSSAVIQDNGKFLAVGSSNVPYSSNFTVASYNKDGALDLTFGGGDGIVTVDFTDFGELGMGVSLDKQGRAVAVGYVNSAEGSYTIARLLMDPSPSPFEFDRFGRTDSSVLWPSDAAGIAGAR